MTASPKPERLSVSSRTPHPHAPSKPSPLSKQFDAADLIQPDETSTSTANSQNIMLTVTSTTTSTTTSAAPDDALTVPSAAASESSPPEAQTPMSTATPMIEPSRLSVQQSPLSSNLDRRPTLNNILGPTQPEPETNVNSVNHNSQAGTPIPSNSDHPSRPPTRPRWATAPTPASAAPAPASATPTPPSTAPMLATRAPSPAVATLAPLSSLPPILSLAPPTSNTTDVFEYQPYPPSTSATSRSGSTIPPGSKPPIHDVFQPLLPPPFPCPSTTPRQDLTAYFEDRLRRLQSRQAELKSSLTELRHQCNQFLVEENAAKVKMGTTRSQAAEAEYVAKRGLRLWIQEDVAADESTLGKLNEEIERWQGWLQEVRRGVRCSRPIHRSNEGDRKRTFEGVMKLP